MIPGAFFGIYQFTGLTSPVSLKNWGTPDFSLPLIFALIKSIVYSIKFRRLF